MRMTAGFLVLVLVAACGAGPTGTQRHAAARFEPRAGCSTGVGPVAESREFVAWADQVDHPGGLKAAYRPVPSSVLRTWPFRSDLEGLAARGFRRANGYLTVVYAAESLPAGFADLLPEGGLSLSARRVAPGSGDWARDVQQVFGPRMTPVQVGTVEGTLNWADPDARGTRPHWVSWEEHGHHYDLLGVRPPADLVVLARSLVCVQAL